LGALPGWAANKDIEVWFQNKAGWTEGLDEYVWAMIGSRRIPPV